MKFRAWDIANKKFVYGFLKKNYFDCSFNQDGLDGTEDETNLENLLLDDWQQFTGLHDKNGKEIYEGDIVKYKILEGFDCEGENWRDSKNVKDCPPKEVKFQNGEYFPRETSSIPDDAYYAYRFFDIEVIGNIYETPELLNNPKTI